MRAISLAVLLIYGTARAGKAWAGDSSKTEEGIAAFQAGRYSTAASLLQPATDTRGRVFYALTIAAQGDCQGALRVLPSVSGLDRELQRLAGVAAVRCLSATGDDAAAVARWRSLQKNFPNDADLLYAGAKLHMKSFNDATLQMFQRAPASYRVHQLSAEIFEVQNRYEEAVNEFRKAIELNPKAPDLHFRLGRAMLLQSHEAQALDHAAEQFRLELAVSPEDSASEFQLAQIALVKSDTTEADKHLQRAVKLTPTYVAPMVALGKLRSREKNYSEAIRLLGEAVRLQPNNETAHYALMTAYRDNGQMKEAKAEKTVLDRLQKPPEGEFSNFLKKLGEKPKSQ